MDQRSSRIAKNTFMLYIRMFINLSIGLYTGRVILAALGVEDFGIYNVVGGVVGMFTIVSSSLSLAISRFITFEIGTGNHQRLTKIFSTSLVIAAAIALIIVLLVESGGVWFLSHKMVIPPNKLYGAKWVLQLSLLSTVFSLFRVPYSAAVVAHEKMSFFAWITLFESVSKLTVALLISHTSHNRLIFYTSLICIVSAIVNLLLILFAKHHFSECKNAKPKYYKDIFVEMFSFAGWNFIGSSSVILREQGGNILLNLFGGPTINAAKAISSQVVNAVSSFSGNFMVALAPQITKSYASKELDYMMSLVFKGARFSFYLLLLLSAPILLNTDYILALWLKNVPAHTNLFVQLTLICCLIESLSSTLITAMSATGDIRNYQIIVGGINLLNFPISYILLKQGFIPEVVVMVAIAITIICLLCRLILLKKAIGLNSRSFIRKVILNVVVVSALSLCLPLIVREMIDNETLNFIITTLISLLSTALAVYFVGCSSAERLATNKAIKNICK